VTDDADDRRLGLRMVRECSVCASTHNLTSCNYCGATMCVDCTHDHEPECEDNDEKETP